MILAAHSRETLIDFLEKSQEILAAFRGRRPFLLHRGLELASLDPSVCVSIFRSSPKNFQRDFHGPLFLLV